MSAKIIVGALVTEVFDRRKTSKKVTRYDTITGKPYEIEDYDYEYYLNGEKIELNTFIRQAGLTRFYNYYDDVIGLEVDDYYSGISEIDYRGTMEDVIYKFTKAGIHATPKLYVRTHDE